MPLGSFPTGSMRRLRGTSSSVGGLLIGRSPATSCWSSLQDEPILVTCVWDRGRAPGKPDLLSFAAIPDDPPTGIAATGHDRCIVPLRPDNIARWLDPERSSIEALDALLDDRQRPYYEHRLAA